MFGLKIIKKSRYNELIDALDHIDRVSNEGHKATRRLTWIGYRAYCAQYGKGEEWRSMPYPKKHKAIQTVGGK